MHQILRPILKSSLGLYVLLAVVLYGSSFAGRTQADEEKPTEAKKEAAAPPVAVPVATGSIEGQILFQGKAPAPVLIARPGAPLPGNIRLAVGIPDERLLVDPKTNGIANVLVYLPKPPAGFVRAAPRLAVPFSQNGFQFTPHVLIAQSGQTIDFVNGDPVPCNLHSFPVRNRSFNSVIPAAGLGPAAAAIEVSYPQSERLQIALRSDLYPWMSAYILVQDHPFAAVTDTVGKFTIPNLPVGKHEFVVWHERAGSLNRKLPVTVTAGKATNVPLAFPADKFP